MKRQQKNQHVFMLFQGAFLSLCITGIFFGAQHSYGPDTIRLKTFETL